MSRDIDNALQDWPYDSGRQDVMAREIQTKEGRTVVQLRIDLGVLQMEIDGRPDGNRPHGHATYLDFLKRRARKAQRRAASSSGIQESWTMSVRQCAEADRELLQFYHRRIALLSLQQYDRALRDAEHSLGLMDLIADFGPDPDFISRHERLRGGILFDHTQAAVAIALEDCRPEEAIEVIRGGIGRIEKHRENLDELEDELGTVIDHAELMDSSEVIETDDNSDENLIERLRQLETEIRLHFDVPKSLQEQLDEAVEREEYEVAARLRDRIRDQEER